MSEYPLPPAAIVSALRQGLVIPAHPLALDDRRKFDERRQRALTRYYHAAGAGGIAVGVHSTQFAIHEPEVGLLKPVLELAAETIKDYDHKTNRQSVLAAGICGLTDQALSEARLACDLGYHVGLLSLADFKDASDDDLIAHCTAVAHEIPLMGFYLQQAAGGRLLSEAFWRRFLEIPNVVAIKIAPFNRYHMLDVVRAVASSGRISEVALYTGNDDHILLDLLTEYSLPSPHGQVSVPIVGGLLGHWACWTHEVAAIMDRVQKIRLNGMIPREMLTLAAQITDCNAAFFDAANGYAGSLPGVQEVLRRQGLVANNYTLDPQDRLSPGQAEEIDRVYQAYPHLNDDAFVRNNLSIWLN